MPWDQAWSNLQAAIPALETAGLFGLVVAAYFLTQRMTGIRNVPAIVARDMLVVALLWISATTLVLLEPNHHWMQLGANWLVNLW